jgi:hypothetical protein
MLREPQSMERQMLQSSTTHQSSESDNDENILNPPKRRKREAHSSISSMARLDGIEHWLEVQRNVRLRCKNDRCSMKSNVYCTKCQVHLCLNLARICFKNYHCKN